MSEAIEFDEAAYAAQVEEDERKIARWNPWHKFVTYATLVAVVVTSLLTWGTVTYVISQGWVSDWKIVHVLLHACAGYNLYFGVHYWFTNYRDHLHCVRRDGDWAHMASYMRYTLKHELIWHSPLGMLMWWMTIPMHAKRWYDEISSRRDWEHLGKTLLTIGIVAVVVLLAGCGAPEKSEVDHIAQYMKNPSKIIEGFFALYAIVATLLIIHSSDSDVVSMAHALRIVGAITAAAAPLIYITNENMNHAIALGVSGAIATIFTTVVFWKDFHPKPRPRQAPAKSAEATGS